MSEAKLRSILGTILLRCEMKYDSVEELQRSLKEFVQAHDGADAPYDKWEPADLPSLPGHDSPDGAWVNSRYQVEVHRNEVDVKGFPKMHWLSIKRLDKEAIHDWRDLQRIKNDLIGPEHEGMEVYPAESRLVDSSNQYHLWVLAKEGVGFPLGFGERFISEGGVETGAGKSRQRPFEKRPDDCKTNEELKKIVKDHFEDAEREEREELKERRAQHKLGKR